MEKKFEVDETDDGRWRVVDVEHKPHRYPVGQFHASKEDAEARAEKYNLIMAE